MDANNDDLEPHHLPLEDFEMQLINKYLRDRGHDPDALRKRDDPEAHKLLADASTYAAGKLAEVETRSRMIHDLHGTD